MIAPAVAIGFAGTVLLQIATAGALAEAPKFSLPVSCELKTDCFIQQYVDADPGPGVKDYTCGPLSYDGHKGTDIRVIATLDVSRGVAVTAAAPGIVRALRDGEPDRLVKTPDDRRRIAGRECGNGVVIEHDDGWQTQYCHMRKGSVAVSEGERVIRGQRIGEVGYSGNAAFPHLHFQVRHKGQVVDPFDAGAAPGSCGDDAQSSLWDAGLKDALAYETARVLGFGFTGGEVVLDELVHGTLEPLSPARNAPAIVIYAWAINLLKGDEMYLSISGPEGELVSRKLPPFDRHKAQQMVFTGKRRPVGGWMPGVYTGHFRLMRNGNAIRTLTESFAIE